MISIINEYYTKRRVLRVYIDNDKRAKILISYKLNVENKNKPRLIKDKVSFWLESGNRRGGRFEGETPLVFVRKDHINDLDILDFANRLFIGLKECKNERDIIRLYELASGSKDTTYEIKDLMRSFGSDSDTHLKMPDYGYIAIKHNTFKETTKDTHIKSINKALGKERMPK